MKKRTSAISVFQYLDYRKFLVDWYREAKRSRPRMTFRAFSKKAGLKSTNFLKLVMDGDRNLSNEGIAQFATGLNLNKQEQEFFHHLVSYNQAKTDEQKNLAYQPLLRNRKFNQLKPIQKGQYAYYSDWYHPVIRELILSHKFDGTPESIAKQIFPPVTTTQVEKSLTILEKLGLIEKTSNNRWKQASSLVSTGAEVSSHIVFNYQKNLLDLTKDILQQLPAMKRDVSSMTLGIVKGRLPELKKKVQEFRQEILKMVAMDKKIDDVVQLNIQLFPLTDSGPTQDAGETP